MSISSLIPVGTAPTSPREVWAPPLAMRANWKNPITVRTGFETRIEQALTLSEQRWLMRGTPRRSMSLSLTGTSRIETLAARQLLTRQTMSGFLMPLYPDQMVLTSAASATDTVLNVDTTLLRRVFVGDRVFVMATELQAIQSFEVAEVTAKSATTITIDAPGLVGNYSAGALVFPAMECRLIDDYSNGFVLTTDKADFQNVTSQEIVGPTQIEGTETVGSNPSGFDTFNSLPVFDGPVDYSQIRFGINRIGSYSDVGIAASPVFYGERGVQQFNLLIQCTNRQEAWDFIRFFESRGGRAYPFFLRSPFEDYKVNGTNGNNLLVEDTGELLDWNYRPYLVMELDDGTFDYREIETVTQNGANHEISFVGGAALGTVVGARQLLLMRMYRDEVAERWITTEICQLTLETVELLEEKNVTMTETLSTHTGDSIVTESGDLIGLGINVSYETTAAISPDLSMGGCEGSAISPFKLIFASIQTPPQDNIVAINPTTGALNGSTSDITANDFASGDDATGASFRGNWFLVIRNGANTDYYLHNVLTGNTVTISLGADEERILSDEGTYRVDSSGNCYILLKHEYDTINGYYTYKLRKYNSAGVAQWTYDIGSDDATDTTAYSILSVSPPTSNNTIALSYNDLRAVSTVGTGVRVINTSTGALLYDVEVCAIAFGAANVALNYESGVPYIYVNHNAGVTWLGGSGGTNLAKFNLSGTLLWEYDTNEGALCELCVTSDRVYVGKQRGNTHDGQTDPATVLVLDVNGSVLLEMDGGTNFPAGEYLDVDTVTGDAVIASSLSNGLCVFNGTTGAIRWSDTDPGTTWGIAFDEYPILYSNGSS